MTGNACIDALVAAGKITEGEAQEIWTNMSRLASRMAKAQNTTPEQALAQMEKGISEREVLLDKVAKRNTLLNIRAKNNLKDFARRFKTFGAGVRAFLEGSAQNIPGGRLSIDSQTKALHTKYFGGLVTELDQAGVLADFKSGAIEKEIFIEMGELRPGGEPGKSGNKAAAKVAAILHNNMHEMVRRQNLAGAYITMVPGYVMRQTHDMSSIRYAGHSSGPLSKETSFQAWSRAVLPLLDHEKTFGVNKAEDFLRMVHEGLYTGTHGPGPGAEMSYTSMYPSTAAKLSASRVLHFKDAESAYHYNQQFGLRNLQDQVFSDLYYRSRNITVMENLGPNPEATFRQAMRELADESRDFDRAAEQADSLRDWKIEATFREAIGFNDNPVNVTMHRTASAVRLVTQMAKMGAVTITSLTDKAFFQSELAFNGVNYLKTFFTQFTALLPKGREQKRALRLWGAMIDGLIGNTISRYSSHDTTSGFMHRLQRKFFDLNFLNWWTDNHKGAAAELLVAHLGEHLDMPWTSLPDDLSRVLSLYDIGANEWNAIRSIGTREFQGKRWIWPENIRNISPDHVDPILRGMGQEVTGLNRARALDLLETKLRAYITDRADYAVPTPGIAQKKWMTLNTQQGTPLGEVMRTLMMFKAFPTTILTKVLARDVYGRGSSSLKDWIKSDHLGKFWIAHTIAVTTVLGYFSGAIKDLLRGNTPKELIDEEGKVNWDTVNDAALRGGGLGILGDVLAQEYGRSTRGFLAQTAGGPVFGQADTLAQIYSQMIRGENVSKEAGKFFQDNIPYINLFYIRPVLDYFILWNLQEMLEPGSRRRYEERIKERYGQESWVSP